MKNLVMAQLSVVGNFDITLGDRVVSYTLKRSSTARLVWLKIMKQTGLTVTIPRKYPVKNVSAYLKANSDWIMRHLTRYERDSSEPPKKPAPFPDTISYLGKPIAITTFLNPGERPLIRLEHDRLIIKMNNIEKIPLPVALEYWMREQAGQLIINKAKLYSDQIGVACRRITIRDQRSRWGSCSRLKNLNFNWRLIMAPETVLDYVVIHELCHLKEMNHSKSFWSLVARYCPQWKERRKWLNKHGKELRTVLPA
jgi:predicted metal-dependent hydrolase